MQEYVSMCMKIRQELMNSHLNNSQKFSLIVIWILDKEKKSIQKIHKDIYRFDFYFTDD